MQRPFRYSLGHMRFVMFATFFMLTLLAAAEQPASQLNKLKFDPRISPKYVELLRQHAEARKVFYSKQAKIKADLKEEQTNERNSLLEKHRAARAEFSKEKHTA